jgi:hypothetical protein
MDTLTVRLASLILISKESPVNNLTFRGYEYSGSTPDKGAIFTSSPNA